MNQSQEGRREREGEGGERKRETIPHLSEKCCLRQFPCRSLEELSLLLTRENESGQPWGEWGEIRIMNNLPFSHKGLDMPSTDIRTLKTSLM